MLPPVNEHTGAYPSMWNTMFPDREAGLESKLYDDVLLKTRSVPWKETEKQPSAPRKPRKKTPFDWGKVAANYDVPEWAKMKHAKPYLSRAGSTQDASGARESALQSRSTSRRTRESRASAADGKEMTECQPEPHPRDGQDGDYNGYYLPVEQSEEADGHLSSSGNWKNDTNPNVFVYGKKTKRDAYLNDAIYQTETAGHYLQEKRLHEEKQAAKSMDKHRNRAKQIEDEVRRFFLPPLVKKPNLGNCEPGENPGRLSRMDTEIISANTGWRTKIIRRFHTQHPDPSYQINMPKFSYMAGLMAKNK